MVENMKCVGQRHTRSTKSFDCLNDTRRLHIALAIVVAAHNENTGVVPLRNFYESVQLLEIIVISGKENPLIFNCPR